MTLFKPGMEAKYTLPDETTIGIPGGELSGRALDVAIAARLFGLKVEPRVNARTREEDWVYEANPGAWVRVSFYSERMGPCLNVEAELSKRGWKRRDSRPGHVIFEYKDSRVIEAKGPRPNMAICRAALKTVGALR